MEPGESSTGPDLLWCCSLMPSGMLCKPPAVCRLSSLVPVWTLLLPLQWLPPSGEGTEAHQTTQDFALRVEELISSSLHPLIGDQHFFLLLQPLSSNILLYSTLTSANGSNYGFNRPQSVPLKESPSGLFIFREFQQMTTGFSDIFFAVNFRVKRLPVLMFAIQVHFRFCLPSSYFPTPWDRT